MPPPIIKLNTLVGDNEKVTVDPISKFFIIFENLLGFNRIRILCDRKYNKIFKLLTVTLSLIMNCAMFYLIVVKYGRRPAKYLGVNAFGYTFSTIYSFVIWKQLNSFYRELNVFDMEAGSGPKVVPGSTRNLIHMSISFIWIITIWVISLVFYTVGCFNCALLDTVLLLVRFIYTLEYHYYGHLFNLLICKVRYINTCVEASLSETTSRQTKDEEKLRVKHIKNLHIIKLTDLYDYVITAYDYLVAAIKWQLLISIVTAFILLLQVAYDLSIKLIYGDTRWTSIILEVITTVVYILPFFAPCVSGDELHREVLRLRELIASKLYQNNLDKVSRSSARTLLVLTETRDLSFALLRMWNIDISFPFKFIGLLITYLIILLQFEKVMNPDRL